MTDLERDKLSLLTETRRSLEGFAHRKGCAAYNHYASHEREVTWRWDIARPRRGECAILGRCVPYRTLPVARASQAEALPIDMLWVDTDVPRDLLWEPRIMANDTVELLQGTLDLLILKTLSWGSTHGYGIARWIQHVTGDVLRIEEGSLYPALHRLEKRGWISAGVGTLREQPPCEVLPTHDTRPSAIPR